MAAGQNTADLAVTAVNANGGDHHRWRRQCRQPDRRGDQPGRHPADRHHDADGVVGGGVGHRHHQLAPATSTPARLVTLTLDHERGGDGQHRGGTPTLTLNDGGTATYSGGSGTSALTFSYTVAAGQNTADLAVTAVNANGATIADGAGNAANLTGAVTNPAGTLQIDTTTPTVSSVATSGTGITAAGDLDAGKRGDADARP